MKNSASRHGLFLGEDGKKHEELFSLLFSKILKYNEACQKNSQKKQILEEIYKSLKGSCISSEVKDEGIFTLSMQELHWLERHESLIWLDYLVYRYKFKVFPAKKKLLDFPLHLLIEVASVCNLRCIMCFQADKTFTENKKNMGLMPWELFVNVVDQAKEHGCNAITLASRGEPLLHKRFGDMVRYLRVAKIMDVKINTNATKLNEKACHDILSAGVNEVVFSVDACDRETYEGIRINGKFAEVVSNIDSFHKIKSKEYPNSQTVTRISGVWLGENQNIDKIYKFWSKRVDQVVIKKAIPRWDSYKNLKSETTNPCNLLWERMYVWFDGTVNPCDIDYHSFLEMGNAYEKSLSEIWLSARYRKLRTDHAGRKRVGHYPCDRCVLG